MYTLNLTNTNENITITYYARHWATLCDFKRQLKRDYEEVGWVEGEDFTLEFGKDVEVENDGLEMIQPGIYMDAE